jgi:hypothetical protein
MAQGIRHLLRGTVLGSRTPDHAVRYAEEAGVHRMLIACGGATWPGAFWPPRLCCRSQGPHAVQASPGIIAAFDRAEPAGVPATFAIRRGWCRWRGLLPLPLSPDPDSSIAEAARLRRKRERVRKKSPR